MSQPERIRRPDFWFPPGQREHISAEMAGLALDIFNESWQLLQQGENADDGSRQFNWVNGVGQVGIAADPIAYADLYPDSSTLMYFGAPKQRYPEFREMFSSVTLPYYYAQVHPDMPKEAFIRLISKFQIPNTSAGPARWTNIEYGIYHLPSPETPLDTPCEEACLEFAASLHSFTENGVEIYEDPYVKISKWAIASLRAARRGKYN
jgi:hypothetical protein